MWINDDLQTLFQLVHWSALVFPTFTKIHHLDKMLTLSYDPIFGHKYYQHVPYSKYYIDYNIRGHMDFYEPERKSKWYPHYWSSHLMERTPSEYSLRSLRVSLYLNLKGFVKRFFGIFSLGTIYTDWFPLSKGKWHQCICFFE